MSTPLPVVKAAGELFVFAGAGASYAPPACLPMFNPMRTEILRQLNLDEYIPVSDKEKDQTPRTRIAAGLAPEPFMLALRSSGVNVEGWLHATLSGGRSNAVHHALAQLAAAGAAVWTVNFDTLIEDVPSVALSTLAWPNPPDRLGGAAVVKPHGSLPGPLIVTADQVLRGMEPAWIEALGAAVAGRTVAFIGYSARDLDFQPLWDMLLTEARAVLWFAYLDDPDEVTRRQVLLRTTHTRGKLHLVAAADGSNPSLDFVRWLLDQSLVDLESGLVEQLTEDPVTPSLPQLTTPGDPSLRRAGAAIRGLLGDASGARQAYREMLRHDRGRLQSARSIVAVELNEGGRPVARLLSAAARVVVLPRSLHRALKRKALTAYSRLGEHDRVLAGTRRLGPSAMSTLLILRSASLRVTANLDEAANVADEAYRRAKDVEHEGVRTAHAAFQQAMALLWAERIPQCRRCLDERLQPSAAIAAARWVAWADFVAGGVALREGNTAAAERYYALSEARFRGEGLGDGIVSVQTARLTMYRQMRNDAQYALALRAVSDAMTVETEGTKYFGRGHRFTREAVFADRAEFARTRGDVNLAARLYGEVAASRFPLQASLGLLGMGLIAVELSTGRGALRAAAALGKRIGARLITRHAVAALAAPEGSRPEEVFFC